MTIYPGDTVRLVAEFRTFADVLCDPDTITVRHQDPSGNIGTSTYTTTGWAHPSTGTYTFDLAIDEAGTWQYSFEGTGAVDVYGESSFTVNAKAF